MRLIACHIENFGKLSNLNINFNDGINIINEPNGWGKSTMAAFLKAMLYGFDTKKEPGAFEKERKLYRPWQGGAYGGELDFQIDKKKYRISRTFGTTEKTDEFHLYDLDTNLEVDDYSSAIGEEIFDLDRASFKRSIYIAQSDIVTESSDAINAKLGNLAANTNDINNFESAQALIKDMMNKLSPNRITGSIKKRKNSLALIEQELKGYAAAESAVAEITAKLEQKQEQKQELAEIRLEYGKALQVASEDSRRTEAKRNYNALCDDVEEKLKIYQEYADSFDGNIPTDDEFKRWSEKARKLEDKIVIARNLAFSDDETKEYERIKKSLNNKIPTEETLDSMQDKVNKVSRIKNEHNQLEMKLSQMESVAILTTGDEFDTNPRKSKLMPIGIAIFILGIIAGAAALIMSIGFGNKAIEIILLVLGGVGVVAAAGGIFLTVIGMKHNKEYARELLRKLEEKAEQKRAKEEPISEMRNQLQLIEEGVTALDEEIRNFFADYNLNCNESEYQARFFELQTMIQDYYRLKDRKVKYTETIEACANLKSELIGFARKMKIDEKKDFSSSIAQLQTKAAECRLAQKTYESAKAKVSLFEEKNDMEKLLGPLDCPYSIDELNNMISEVDARTEDVREAMEQYNRQLEDLQEQLDIRDEKEQELRNGKELQEEESRKYDVLESTASFLQAARDQFTARYMAPISNGFQKYYEILTGDTSRNWMIDANISIKVREYGELRDINWLSAGNRDLLAMCMRFALVDAMFPDEKPFLILDDPFVNLDDEKIEHGKQLLIALEKEYQAIYFTCHESREYKDV